MWTTTSREELPNFGNALELIWQCVCDMLAMFWTVWLGAKRSPSSLGLGQRGRQGRLAPSALGRQGRMHLHWMY